MSKRDLELVARIEKILKCDREYALEIFEVVEEYFSPDFSEMTHKEFDSDVRVAHMFVKKGML